MPEKQHSEALVEQIAALVQQCSQNQRAGKESLTRLFSPDPRAFCTAAIRVLARTSAGQTIFPLVHLISKEGLFASGLLDPECRLQDATSAAKLVAASGSPLQATLLRELRSLLQNGASQEGTGRILRVLDVLGALSAQRSLHHFEQELMRYPDTRVRSKAVLLIGVGSKSAAWVERHLSDQDPRVQASVIETLDSLEDADPKPWLRAALKSDSNRVVGNAALALYRLADSVAISALLNLFRHPDLAFQLSGLWAIGETQDTRFAPLLKQELKHSEGRKRLAIMRALSRIRKHESTAVESDSLRVEITEVFREGDARRVEFTLWSPSAADLTALKPTEVALWEGGTLIEDYELRCQERQPPLAIGFIAPRFVTIADRYAAAAEVAMQACARFKRPEDTWRVDRYRLGSPEDFWLAIDRQLASARSRKAERHIFVLGDEFSEAEQKPAEFVHWPELIHNSKISLHGVVPDGAQGYQPFEALCLASPNGTLQRTTFGLLPQAIGHIYSGWLNRFEVGYRLPAGARPGLGRLTISSRVGKGEAEYSGCR